jgi:hypothetical protein
MTCKLHPKYKGKRPPTAKQLECTCEMIWKREVTLRAVTAYGLKNALQ